jgi:hypothetical protein
LTSILVLQVLNEIGKIMFTPPFRLAGYILSRELRMDRSNRQIIRGKKKYAKELLARFVIDSDKIEKIPVGIVASLAHNRYAILSDSTKDALTP